MATPANTITVIDFLLSKTEANELHLKKIEIVVPISNFEGGHIPREVFTYLQQNMRGYYIHFNSLIVDRNIS